MAYCRSSDTCDLYIFYGPGGYTIFRNGNVHAVYKEYASDVLAYIRDGNYRVPQHTIDRLRDDVARYEKTQTE